MGLQRRSRPAQPLPSTVPAGTHMCLAEIATSPACLSDAPTCQPLQHRTLNVCRLSTADMIALVEGRTQSPRPATTAKYNGQLKKLTVRACQWRQMVLSIMRAPCRRRIQAILALTSCCVQWFFKHSDGTDGHAAGAVRQQPLDDNLAAPAGRDIACRFIQWCAAGMPGYDNTKTDQLVGCGAVSMHETPNHLDAAALGAAWSMPCAPEWQRC